MILRCIFDYDKKVKQLTDISQQLESPAVWANPEKAKKLGQERASLERSIAKLTGHLDTLDEAESLLKLAIEEQEQDMLNVLHADLTALDEGLAKLEFERMFSGEMDFCHAYLDVQSGSGGTEAQDWADMVLRMYLRFGEQQNFKTELVAVSAGEVAGIKSATLRFEGDYAFGLLRTETGVHRLVRKSPFDSGARRHTSFCSVFVYPEIDDDIEIDINKADLRIDTYRASGAGGQHVNKTDSAVRITHVPTHTVVQCQSQRSQHKNKNAAMNLLKAKLHELELLKKNEQKQAAEADKADIGWGSQIRSYVLDQALIKDLRTQVEIGNTQAVLDGDLMLFIEASLKSGL